MNKIKVLIVDDEENDWAVPYKDWLEALGEFQVQTHPYAVGITEYAQDFEPDIILMDWWLGNGKEFGMWADGIAVANKLRRDHHEFDKIPILIVTQVEEEAKPILGSNHEAKGIYISSKDSEEVILARIGNALFRWT